MAFAMKGGGGSRVPLKYLKKMFKNHPKSLQKNPTKPSKIPQNYRIGISKIFSIPGYPRIPLMPAHDTWYTDHIKTLHQVQYRESLGWWPGLWFFTLGGSAGPSLHPPQTYNLRDCIQCTPLHLSHLSEPYNHQSCTQCISSHLL